MKKTLLILISVFAITMSACNEEEEFTYKEEVPAPPIEESLPPPEIQYKTITVDPMARGLVIDVKNYYDYEHQQHKIMMIEVFNSDDTEVSIPETFELKLDQNNIYHLTGDMASIPCPENISSPLYSIVDFPIKVLDSVAIYNGEVDVYGGIHDLRLGIYGHSNFSLNESLGSVYVNLVSGSFKGTSRSSKCISKMYLYDYSESTSSAGVAVDSLFYYAKTAKTYYNGIGVAKYLTGMPNSVPFIVNDLSCLYENSNLEIDPNIESIVTVSDYRPEDCWVK